MIKLVLLGLMAFQWSLLAKDTADLNLVPWPNKIKVSSGFLKLNQESRIVFEDSILEPLAKVLSDEIANTHWLKLKTVSDKAKAGDIVLSINKKLKKERHVVRTGDEIEIQGGNYRAVAWGTVTLLQALQSNKGNVQMPKLVIDDEPEVEYRGVLVDTGRNYHPVETMKELIVMCRLYKINYMQLHLTDDQLFSFPSKHFSELPSVKGGKAKHFKMDELLDIVKFADERGVTLVPELETPGHSRILRSNKMFGRKGLGCVNMASEETYKGFEILIGEICEVFKSSPFFHIGTDESNTKGLGTTKEEKAYMAKHDLKNNREIFDHHIVRLDAIIKKHGKQTIRWGGFKHGEKRRIQTPKDIIHMVWDVKGKGTISSVDRPIINAAWKPLYVVGTKAWLPKYLIENWHIRLWQFHMNNSPGVTATPNVPVFGAQMCAWEQPPEVELSSLRWRLPAMCERIYNSDSGKKYEDFIRRFDVTDELLDRMFTPVRCEVDALVGPKSNRAFTGEATFSLSSIEGSVIRYTLDGSEPGPDSTLYSEPFKINVKDVKPEGFFWSRPHGRHLRTTPRVHVNVAAYDADGKLIGIKRDNFYHAIAPRVTAKIYFSPKQFDNTKRDWKTPRDWEKMGMKPDMELLWPDLVFATPLASRDAVCVPFCSGVISRGKIKIKEKGEYLFCYPEAGGEVYIDGKMITKSDVGKLEVVKLSEGLHDIKVIYAYPHMFFWGTQSLLYVKLKPGQNMDELFSARQNKKEAWKAPLIPRKGESPWRDHAELLVPLEDSVVEKFKQPGVLVSK